MAIKTYNDLETFMDERLDPLKEVLKNKDEIKEKIKVGNKSLVDLMVKGFERSINELAGKYLTDEKEKYFHYWIAFNNSFNNMAFVNNYAGDLQEWLPQLYPNESSKLNCLSKDDIRDAFVIAVNDEKIPGLLDFYKKNPHMEMTNEQIRTIKSQKELKQKLSKTKKTGSNDKQNKMNRNKLFKRMFIMGALVLSFSTFMSYQMHSLEKKQKELDVIIETVKNKYGDTDKDGHVDQREKLALYKDIAKQNNVSFVDGQFKDNQGDVADPDKVMNWFKDYKPSLGFEKK